MGRYSRVSTAWLLLLLFPPFGWLVLLAIAVFAPDRSEMLRVQVPWTESAQQRVDTLRRRKGALWGTVLLSVVGLVVALGPAGGAGVDQMTARAGIALLAGVAVVAFVGVIVTEAQIGRATIAVDLDASRRWVTLDNVHPWFRDAVQQQQRQSGAAPTR